MAQNIYDRADFFAGYSQLPRSIRGLEGAVEWPALAARLAELSGRRIVDLGCGFGWFSRWAAAQGAAHVLGIDISENMLARARAETTSPAISYRQADLESLDLETASFDLAYSSLAFHYIADFGRLVGVLFRALVPGGRLVFSIEHPIYTAPRRAGWLTRDDGHKSWPIDSYASEGARVTDWLAKGVIKQHRTLGTTLNTLIGTGFNIRHVEEWQPSTAQIRKDPALAELRERPIFLIVAAER